LESGEFTNKAKTKIRSHGSSIDRETVACYLRKVRDKNNTYKQDLKLAQDLVNKACAMVKAQNPDISTSVDAWVVKKGPKNRLKLVFQNR
jgi:hypothetical protein